jgi:hypothetical protein
MSAAIARLVWRLYPLAFRRRYGEEMDALLEDSLPRPALAIDLARGALREHVRPSAATAGCVGAGDRVRASACGVLACWLAFSAAGFGFYKTTENDQAAARVHPVLGAAHVAVQLLAVAASLAIVAGALPLIATAIAEARRRRELRLWVTLPPAAVLVEAALTAGLLVVARARTSSSPTVAAALVFVMWGIGGMACGAVCVAGARRVLFAVPLPAARLASTLRWATLVTAAMIAITVAAAVYGIALSIDASPAAGASDGPFQLLTAGASLVVEATVMLAVGSLAVTTTRRGWRGVRGTGSP